MGRASRRKGSRAELEVAALLAKHGIKVRRTPNSGGLAWRGDLQGLEGYTIEVKRCERLDVPGWLRQAYAAARGGEVPVVIFRRSGESWHVIEPLEEWARKVASLEGDAGSTPDPSEALRTAPIDAETRARTGQAESLDAEAA